MKSKTQLKEDKIMAWLLFGYAVVLITICATFSPLYGFNDWPDINVYHTMGKAMMDGKILYKDVFDHKGPFIFLLYGFASLLPGAFLGAYLLEIVFLFFSLWFVYKIANLYLGRIYSFICALLYSFFPFIYSGPGGSAEELALPFFLISFYFLLKYFKDGGVHDPFWMLIHGIMFSLVFLIKLNLVAFWIFVPALFIYFLIKGEYHLVIRNLITLVLGAFLVGTPTFFYFYFTDSLHDLYHSYIEFNLLYGGTMVDYDFAMGLVSRFFRFILSHYVLMSSILIGLGVFSVSKKFISNWGLKLILLLTFIATFCAIFASPTVFGYYYIILTVFALLGIISVVYYLAGLVKEPEFKMIYSVGTVVALLLIGAIFITKKETLTAHEPNDLIKSFAAEIQKEPRNEQTLLCLGLNYGICLFTEADIMPTVKYFFTPNIKKEVYPAINDAQRAYIENRALNFVVVRENYRDYHTLLPYLEENYEKVKTHSLGEQVYYLYKRKS